MPFINYYSEGALANSNLSNWNNSTTYTMTDITGLGTVTCHGPNPGNYTFTLTNLPAHAKIRYQVFWHFVDSLDNETSSIYIDNVEYATFTKTGFPGAGTPGAPVYSSNYFASATWNPATYSYQPWGSGSTANGYVAFDTGFIDHYTDTFSVRHNLGHDQGQGDEAMYLSHVTVTLFNVLAELPTEGMYLRLDAGIAQSFPGRQRFLFSANLAGNVQTTSFSHWHVGANLPGPLVLITTTTRPPRPTTTTSTTSTSSTTTTTTEPPAPIAVVLTTNLSGTILGHQLPIITATLSEAASAGEFTVSDFVTGGPGSLTNFSYSNTTGVVTYNPPVDTVGSFSIFVPSSSFQGFNNNWNSRSNTLTLTVNTILPEIAITSNRATLKAGEVANLTFTTSNATSNFGITDVRAQGNVVLHSFTALSSTVYRVELTPNVNVAETFTVNVAAGSFTNSIGNRNKASNIVTIGIDTRYPSMVITSSDMALTYGETATITFTSNIATTDFVLADVTITGPGALSAFTAVSSTVYTATLTPTADGSIDISVGANQYSSTAGNPNTTSANLIITSAIATTTSTTTLAITTTTTSTTSTSTSTTTTAGPIIPNLVISGPATYSAGSNTIGMTFDAAVTLSGTAETLIEDASYGIDVTSITQLSASSYTVNATRGGIPYAIIDTGSSVMNGFTGLTRYLTAANTTGSPGDDSVVSITLPFNIQFPTSATTSVSGTEIVVGTNSFIALGSYSGSGLPPGPTLPPIPAIFIGARDSGAYGIWGGSTDGNATYIVRFEGTRHYSENVYNRAWEVVFYASDPTKFTIRIDPTFWETTTDGDSFIKNDTTKIYPKTGNLPIVKGQYLTVASGSYTIQVPAGVATSSTGNPNTASNTLVIPPA